MHNYICRRDAWGDLWDVGSERSTPFGWPVLLGWPHGTRRGRGGSGGAKIIVSDELARHLEQHRLDPKNLRLPIGATSIKRLRRLLGHHRQIDRADWWQARLDELADLTLGVFAARHGCSVAAASTARQAFFGSRQRPAGWWRDPTIAAILSADRPRAEIADALEISIGAVGRLRWALRQEPLERKPSRSASQKAAWADAEIRARRMATLADPKLKARRSAIQRAKWADPEYRARGSAAQKETWADAEIRARRIAAMKDSAVVRSPRKPRVTAPLDCEARARRSARVRAALADPEVRARMSAAQKARWQRDKTV